METFNEYLDVAVNNLLEMAVEQPELIRKIVEDIDLTYDETVVMLREKINELRDNSEWMERYEQMLAALQLLVIFGQDDRAEKVFDSFGTQVLQEISGRIEKGLFKQTVDK